MDARETLIRIVLLALLLYAACCLAATGRALHAADAAADALRAELASAERISRAAEEKLRRGWSEEELEALARERLGLVLPGEKIFLFPSGTEQAGR